MAATPHSGGRNARLTGWHTERRQLVAEASDRRLEDLVDLFRERYRVTTGVPVLSRTLKALEAVS